jgi:hypothetical protein
LRPDDVIVFFLIYLIFPDAQALGFTQPLTEFITRSRKIIFLGSRAGPVRKSNNLTAICEPIVYTMWNPQHNLIGLHSLLQG